LEFGTQFPAGLFFFRPFFPFFPSPPGDHTFRSARLPCFSRLLFPFLWLRHHLLALWMSWLRRGRSCLDLFFLPCCSSFPTAFFTPGCLLFHSSDEHEVFGQDRNMSHNACTYRHTSLLTAPSFPFRPDSLPHKLFALALFAAGFFCFLPES